IILQLSDGHIPPVGEEQPAGVNGVPITAASGDSVQIWITATLTDAFPHSSANQGEGFAITVNGIAVIATDSNNASTDPQSVIVTIIDDAPIAEIGLTGTAPAVDASA